MTAPHAREYPVATLESRVILGETRWECPIADAAVFVRWRDPSVELGHGYPKHCQASFQIVP